MCSKKNWNILRRLSRKTNSIPFSAFCVLLSAFSFLSFVSCDNEEKIYGTWHLQSALMNGKPISDSLQLNVIPKYTYYIFFISSDVMEVISYDSSGEQTISPIGTYHFIDNKTLEMNYRLVSTQYEITAKIKKLTWQELNLEYEDQGNTYFLKLFSS